jgi:hypothetical protein
MPCPFATHALSSARRELRPTWAAEVDADGVRVRPVGESLRDWVIVDTTIPSSGESPWFDACSSPGSGRASARFRSRTLPGRGGWTPDLISWPEPAMFFGDPRRARRTDDRRQPALPGRAARGPGRRAARPGAAGTGGRPLAPAVRRPAVQELPAAGATAREPGDRRAARRRRGRAAHGPAGHPPPDRAAVLRPGRSAPALAAQGPGPPPRSTARRRGPGGSSGRGPARQQRPRAQPGRPPHARGDRGPPGGRAGGLRPGRHSGADAGRGGGGGRRLGEDGAAAPDPGPAAAGGAAGRPPPGHAGRAPGAAGRPPPP